MDVQWKLQVLIQGALILIFMVSQQYLVKHFADQELNEAQSRASDIANGLINGMNILMVTGKIRNASNRTLLLEKMADSPDVKALRIIRAPQVSAQYGPGLPSEQPLDALDQSALNTGKTAVLLSPSARTGPELRVVIPYIVSENFHGTNCLTCHHVKAGSVNGAASVTIDLTRENAQIEQFNRLLWGSNIVFQIGLSGLIAWFIRIIILKNIQQLSQKLEATMLRIRREGNLSLRADIEGKHKNIDQMADTFNRLVENLEQATKDQRLFSEVIKNTKEGILISDANNRIILVNRAFVRITGYSPEEVLGKNPGMLSSGRQGAEFYTLLWQSIATHGHWQGEIWNRRKSGEEYPEWLSISTVKDKHNRITAHVAIFMDITKRKEAEQRIHFLAHYDPLTQLPNRVLFSDRLERALAFHKRNGEKAALLFLDLDRFKNINDSLGHVAGDKLLQSVAERIRRCIRDLDSLCRRGGDEFMILLTGIRQRDDVRSIAQKIIHTMSEPHAIDGHQMTVTFSIGISLYPDDAEHSQALVMHADAAMYQAKKSGRNTFQFYTPDMNAQAFELFSLESELRQALECNALELHYQPQVDNLTGAVIGVEALARWNPPGRDPISPLTFISIAEECGLIHTLGNWVLRTACAQNRQWQEQGLITLPISVNLSALQFYQKDIVDTIVGILRETGLEARYLELELTEGIIMRDAESTIETLNTLKQHGMLLAIDDFGTGYSSLSYLKRFPIDKLKIDQSFTRDIESSESDALIIEAIISMAHSLKLKVVAEGVETAAQLEFLKAHRCDQTQGYLVSRPLSATAFAEFLQARAR